MGALRLVSLFAISALPVTGLLPQGLEAPAHVMMDEIFIIRAHGLMPGSRAVLRAAMAIHLHGSLRGAARDRSGCAVNGGIPNLTYRSQNWEDNFNTAHT